MIISSMTATAAIQHMSHTLTGLIKQSQQPDFIEAYAYADIKPITILEPPAAPAWRPLSGCANIFALATLAMKASLKKLTRATAITLTSSSCQAGVQEPHRRT